MINIKKEHAKSVAVQRQSKTLSHESILKFDIPQHLHNIH